MSDVQPQIHNWLRSVQLEGLRELRREGEDSGRRSVTATHLHRAGPPKVAENKRKMVSESHGELLRIRKERWRRRGRVGVTWRRPNVHRCSTQEQQKPGSTSTDGDPDRFKPGRGGRSIRWLASCTGTVLPNLNWKIWDQKHLQRDSVVEND